MTLKNALTRPLKMPGIRQLRPSNGLLGLVVPTDEPVATRPYKTQHAPKPTLFRTLSLFFMAYLNFVSNAQAVPPGYKPRPAYNEWMSTNKELRHPYMRFQLQFGDHVLFPETHVADKLLGYPLKDANRVLPVPLVLQPHELQMILKGTRQRAEALKLFFVDMIMGHAQIATSGIFPPDFFESFFYPYSLHQLRELWSKKSVDDVAFIYGPDIVRNPQGKFVVLEDNVGDIGGVLDAEAIRAVFHEFHKMGVYEGRVRTRFETWVRHWVSATHVPQNEIYFVTVPVRQLVPLYDTESERVDFLLQSIGLTPYAPQARIRPKLGAVKAILNMQDVTVLFPNATDVKSILNAFRDNQLQLFMGPGIQTLGRKSLLPFVDKIIAFYLQQKPMVPTQTSELVHIADGHPQAARQWVYKASISGSDEDIYILKDLPLGALNASLSRIQSRIDHAELHNRTFAEGFIRQRWVEQSFIPAGSSLGWARFNVDIRPLGCVIGSWSDINEPLWGRATMRVTGARNNVSHGAFQLVIFAQPETQHRLCASAFQGDQ
jgi:hypothetical protein